MAAPLNSPSSSGPAAAAAPAASQIAELTAELQQRDQLIEVLTERLEEAAEQLDRVHRSGGDRALRAGGGGGLGGGVPGEVFDRLLEVADRTEVMAAEWEEVQGGALLNRIDIRLEKLIEIIRGDAPAPEPSPAMMHGSAAENGSRPADHESAAAYSASAVRDDSSDAEAEPEIELADAPQPIDDAESHPETLFQAVRARDEYIEYLIRELRRKHPYRPIDWEALQSCPEEQTAQLKVLETRLQSEIQREELALSLERAKMGRERMELDKIRSRLEREIRGLGKGAAKEETQEQDQTIDQNSRLARLFGRKK
ncbi:MAG: hypothetical protein KDA75_01230 [Planctomycetaceae bacterium]|nr:hypothetical protein [Planctomycetaceae bacterium]